MTKVIRRKHITGRAKASSLNRTNRTLQATISTNQVDRDGEILEPSAFREHIDTFRANPVFLWMHDATKPIGRVSDLDIKSDRIDAEVQFREKGISHESVSVCGAPGCAQGIGVDLR